jgi:hypothetical protein
VHADADIIDDQGNLIAHIAPGDIQLRDLVIGFPMMPQSALIRRSALERSGMMDETRRLAADWDLFLRLAQYYSMHYIPFTAAARRMHSDSEDAKNLVAGGNAAVEVIDRFFERPDLTNDQRSLYKYGVAGSRLVAGWSYCVTGQRSRAWQMLFDATRAHLPSLWTIRAGRRLLMRLLLPENVSPARWVTLKRAINRMAPRL